MRLEREGRGGLAVRLPPPCPAPRALACLCTETGAQGETGNRTGTEAFAANVLPIIRHVEAAGATGYRAIAAALSARAVRTARGGVIGSIGARNPVLIGYMRVSTGFLAPYTTITPRVPSEPRGRSAPPQSPGSRSRPPPPRAV